MTKLVDLINPPSTSRELVDHSKFFNDQFEAIKAMRYLRNDSLLTNGDFRTPAGTGLTPTTNAQGNNAVVVQDWQVFGSTAATYTITPTLYPANSTINSFSSQYLNVSISGFSGLPLYIYQRQPNTVRQYQQNYLTYSLLAKNNGAEQVGLRFDIYFNYGASDSLLSSGIIYLQPGQTMNPTATFTTKSLQGISVTSANYTEFRLNFVSMPTGTANIDIYNIKCELGELGTPF